MNILVSHQAVPSDFATKLRPWFQRELAMCNLPYNMKSSSHKTWQTSLLFLKPLKIKNLKRKRGGILYPPTWKSGGIRPRVAHQIAPMLQRFTLSLWIDTQPSNWEADTTTELSPPQRNVRHRCLGVKWCYVVPLGRYWRTNDKRKKIKLVFFRDFMQSLFIQILRGGPM